MIKYLKEIFKQPANKSETLSENKKLQIATCALFIEMAKTDSEFTEGERKKIITVMQEIFNLEKEYVAELIELSEESVKNAISIYEFTAIINENFSKDEKFQLLKNLWHLIYTDETLNMHEDHLIKRIGNTLNMDHQDVIAAKLLVKEEINKNL
ncbi:MAG TPA: TerB family tellurite resistance protein [Ignavibacteriaceae bacterium]|nr:TerB family tellurite resistance protein [Ignavibacteriaceae bacterium]